MYLYLYIKVIYFLIKPKFRGKIIPHKKNNLVAKQYDLYLQTHPFSNCQVRLVITLFKVGIHYVIQPFPTLIFRLSKLYKYSKSVVRNV